MKITEIMNTKGMVTPSFIDIRTGKRVEWTMRHNTLSYSAAEAMACAFGGDPSFIPNRIGIIYGAEEDPQFDNPISREQSWDSLREELADKNADIQVQSFSYSPSVKKITRNISDGSSSSPSHDPITGEGTAVTFHMHSDSVTEGIFGTYNDDANAAVSTIFTTNTRIYQAVLLNKNRDTYKVLARVSLDSNGRYYTKPENFEVAIDWTVKFF